MKLVIAPDFKAILPPHRDEEINGIREGLKANPAAIPPVIYWANGPKINGGLIIVDGMTRWVEAEKRGIKLRAEGVDLDDRQTAMRFTRMCQAYRRNLTPSQYALLYAELFPASHGGDRKSESALKQGEKNQVAEVQLDLPSPHMHAAANKVVNAASPQVAKAVRDGEVAVQDAAAVTTLPKSEQNKALGKVRSGKAATLRQATKRKSGTQTRKPADRKAALLLLGKLIRTLDKLGLSADLDKELKAINKALKES